MKDVYVIDVTGWFKKLSRWFRDIGAKAHRSSALKQGVILDLEKQKQRQELVEAWTIKTYEVDHNSAKKKFAADKKRVRKVNNTCPKCKGKDISMRCIGKDKQKVSWVNHCTCGHEWPVASTQHVNVWEYERGITHGLVEIFCTWLSLRAPGDFNIAWAEELSRRYITRVLFCSQIDIPVEVIEAHLASSGRNCEGVWKVPLDVPDKYSWELPVEVKSFIETVRSLVHVWERKHVGKIL